MRGWRNEYWISVVRPGRSRPENAYGTLIPFSETDPNAFMMHMTPAFVKNRDGRSVAVRLSEDGRTVKIPRRNREHLITPDPVGEGVDFFVGLLVDEGYIRRKDSHAAKDIMRLQCAVCGV